MNDASTGMRVWRQSQSERASTPSVQVPKSLQIVSAQALTAIWSDAVALSHESMRAAQAGWESKLAEAETLSAQMANAFDMQSAELAVAHEEIEHLTSRSEQLSQALVTSDEAARNAVRQMEAARAAASQANARAELCDRNADDLRRALAHAQATLDATAAESAEQRRAEADEITRLRQELERERTAHERKEFQVQQELRTAIEAAAILPGKLKAIAEGNTPTAGELPDRSDPDGPVCADRPFRATALPPFSG